MERFALSQIETEGSDSAPNLLKVLVVDDDQSLAELLCEFYREKGYQAQYCDSAEQAYRMISHEGTSFDLVISDLNLPGKSGVDLINDLRTGSHKIPVILITAHGSIDHAAKALKLGAFDYITKPLNFTELEVVSTRAIKISSFEREYNDLKQKIIEPTAPHGLIGRSSKMLDLHQLIEKVAQSSANVLITGESGTGKEVVARAIHNSGRRKQNPFVAINCSAIPRDLLEAELFGHKKGAFTGASDDRMGLFAEAEGGTLFLDEIGDMPVDLQAKVLRVLQERKIRSVGGNKDIEINVRVLAATHRDLKTAVRQKEFREDLYYRLCVIPISVPPLRERREDIPVLAVYFLKKYAQQNEKELKGFSKEAMDKLKRLRWGGNVRELENALERAVVLSVADIIEESDISLEGSMEMDEKTSQLFAELMPLKELEKRYIQYVLAKTFFRKEEAAEILGINRKTLYRKEKEYDLKS